MSQPAYKTENWGHEPSSQLENAKLWIVVEDDPDLQSLLGQTLQKNQYRVKAFAKAEDVLKVLDASPELKPAGFIIDLNLAGNMNGLELTKFLRDRKETSKLPMIMLTAKSENVDIIKGLSHGADDYVAKPFDMQVLLARVSACQRRADALPGPIKGHRQRLSSSGIDVDPVAHKVSILGSPLALTGFEYGLLTSFMSKPNEVLSRDDLLLRIVGPNKVVTGRTVDVHIRALRAKMGAAARHIVTVRGFGYKFVP